jgi:hypothetical protein
MFLFSATAAALTAPLTTRYFKIAFSLDMHFRRSSTVPLGNLAKASSVGAKMVKDPSFFKVLTSPVAVATAASVLKVPAATVVSIYQPQNFTKLSKVS